jgi:hypothetical protein
MSKLAAAESGELKLTTLLADVRVLVLLFVSLRVLMLLAYEPIIIDDVERGVGAKGDRVYHYALSALSANDQLPFRDWWSEFPPVWYFLTTAVYQLLGANVTYSSWSMLLGFVMIAFDAGNLLLIRKIGTRLYGGGTGMSLAWVYAVLFAPLVFLWWNFETLVMFWLLLGLWWLLEKRDARSAAACAVGTLVKFTPALLFGAAFRFRELPAALRYAAIALAIFVLAYVPLFVQNAEMAMPSLTAQFGKSSYQTVWALLDGNFGTGNFGDIASHFDPAQASVPTGNPAVIPNVVRLLLAAAIGLWVYARTRCFDDRGLVAFVGITLLIFFLQAQGWSPQWIVQIIPLVLLSFPTRSGIYAIVLLSLMTFAEYPFLFMRTGDTGGEISGALVTPFVILVLARTALLAGLCVAFYQRLRQEPVGASVRNR